MIEIDPASYKVTVGYWAALKDLTKQNEQCIYVPANTPVNQFLSYLLQQQPLLATDQGQKILKTCACAINLEYVDLINDTHDMKDGDQVALIPPVSGG